MDERVLVEWPSLAAAIGGSVVGVAGVAFGYFGGRHDRSHAVRLAEGQRAHERRLAREQQLYEDLRDAYVGMIDVLFKVQREVQATEREVAEGVQPVTVNMEVSDPAVARVYALGSQPVIDALEAAFRIAAAFYSVAQQAGRVCSEVGLAEYVKSDERVVVAEARKAYVAALEAAERLMRDELRGQPSAAS